MPAFTAIRRTPGGVETVSIDAPEPKPGEAIVRPTLLAVTQADVHAAATFDGVLGHQFVGVVESVNGAPEDWVGARVVGDINLVPKDSELARKGLGHHAPDRAVLGLHKKDGCFAERFTLPITNLVRIPDDVSDEHAIFAQPVADAVHASHIVRLESKPYVTIIGDTLTALLCAQVMTRLNASVRLLGKRKDRFDLCDKWGVYHRAIGDAGLRADQDVVIECTGSNQGVELAFGYVRPRGAIVLKTEPNPLPGREPTSEMGPDLTPAILNEIQIVGAREGRIREGMNQIATGGIQLDGLITKTYALQEAPDAFKHVATGEPLAVCLSVS